MSHKSSISPHWIAVASAVLPGLALLVSFLISASEGSIEWCLPTWGGCASISKAARRGSALYAFRLLLVPGGIFELFFWVLLADWFRNFSEPIAATGRRIRLLGILSVFFVILYANFLGTDGALYTFLRRLGIYVYFATTVTAVLLLTLNVHRMERGTEARERMFKALLLVCIAMAVLSLSQGYIKLFVEDHDRLENVIEWNIAIVMHVPFLILGYHWFKSGFTLEMKQ